MKEGFVSLNFIIDMSGSMSHLQEKTIESFNEFIKEQKTLSEEAIVSLCLFNDRPKMIYEMCPLQEVPLLTKEAYIPSGMTALLDAMGSTMESTGKCLANMKENERPSRVLTVIITDGAENVSRDFRHDKIQEMVEHQKTKYAWNFLFLGANIDSFTTASKLNLSAGTSINYTATRRGVADAYHNLSKGVMRFRSDYQSKDTDVFGGSDAQKDQTTSQ